MKRWILCFHFQQHYTLLIQSHKYLDKLLPLELTISLACFVAATSTVCGTLSSLCPILDVALKSRTITYGAELAGTDSGAPSRTIGSRRYFGGL